MCPDDVPGRLLIDCQLDTTVAIVTVNGEIDVATCGPLRDGLLRAIANEACTGLVVNLAGTTFIDSTGVGVLVGIWHRARSARRCLALAAPSRQAQAILESTGLTKVLPIYLPNRGRAGMPRSGRTVRVLRCGRPDASLQNWAGPQRMRLDSMRGRPAASCLRHLSPGFDPGRPDLPVPRPAASGPATDLAI